MSPAEFSATYFHKHKLIALCREYGLPTQGGKLELSDRILTFLKEGDCGECSSKRMSPSKSRKERNDSQFDWHKSKLTRDTLITKNYKNTRNVRNFFLQEIGPQFNMNVAWLAWMRSHAGHSLEAAIVAWQETVREKKAQKGKTIIAPQFEYNRYMRDFMADNQGAKRSDAIRCWKMKRDTLGGHQYERSDRQWL